jgi:hypothetical protein
VWKKSFRNPCGPRAECAWIVLLCLSAARRLSGGVLAGEIDEKINRASVKKRGFRRVADADEGGRQK